jgi:hypothetical protein
MNLLGSTDFVDFRLDSNPKTLPDMNTLLGEAASEGAIMSINHPNSLSGEICLGCGWAPAAPVDMHLFTAVEAVNGADERYGVSDLPFWNKQLNRGCRLTGIGGSDNRRPMQPPDQIGSVGSPTTAVYATELSTQAILDGIRAGHVFIDVAGTRDRVLEVTAQTAGQAAHAGDSLETAQGDAVQFEAHVTAAAGGKVLWIEDGQEIAPPANADVSEAQQTVPLPWKSDGRRHWFRAQVAGPDGKLWLIGNPIYMNWDVSNDCNKPAPKVTNETP